MSSPEDSVKGGTKRLFLLLKKHVRQQSGALNSSGLVILERRIVSSVLCSSHVRACRSCGWTPVTSLAI